MKKYKIGFDMDDVLCDFKKSYESQYSEKQQYPQADARFFDELEPIKRLDINNIDYVLMLQDLGHDIYFITSPSIPNINCWTGKAYWIKKYFGQEYLKKLIITYDKSLLSNSIDILVDDSTKNRQLSFKDRLIIYGSDKYLTIKEVYDQIIEWSNTNKEFQ